MRAEVGALISGTYSPGSTTCPTEAQMHVTCPAKTIKTVRPPAPVSELTNLSDEQRGEGRPLYSVTLTHARLSQRWRE